MMLWILMMFNGIMWGMSLVIYICTWFGKLLVVPEVENHHWLCWFCSGCCGLGDWPAQDYGHCGVGVLDELLRDRFWRWSYSVDDFWQLVAINSPSIFHYLNNYKRNQRLGLWKLRIPPWQMFFQPWCPGSGLGVKSRAYYIWDTSWCWHIGMMSNGSGSRCTFKPWKQYTKHPRCSTVD